MTGVLRHVAAACLLSFPVAVAAEQPDPVIPERYIGTWVGDPVRCEPEVDDLVLRIAPRRLLFWESAGVVRSVVRQDDGAIEVVSELSDEGDTWTRKMRLSLSADGRRLVERSPGRDKVLIRYRCP